MNLVQSALTLEITVIEIGNPRVFGRGSDIKGFTKLSGNFQLDVISMDGTSSKLKTSEGKFNL